MQNEKIREIPKLTRQEMSLTTGMPEGQKYECKRIRDQKAYWWCELAPAWNWYEYCYRPVAPEGYKHRDDFEIPCYGDIALDWETGKAWYCSHDGSFIDRHWILGPDTPKLEEPEESDQVEYEIMYKPNDLPYDSYGISLEPDHFENTQVRFIWTKVSKLPGLVIDGRPFDGFKWPDNLTPAGASRFIFYAIRGEFPTHAIFRRPDKEN